MAITIFVKTVDRRNCSNDDIDEYPYNAVMVCVNSIKTTVKLWIYPLFIKKQPYIMVSLLYSIGHLVVAKRAWAPKGARMMRMRGRTM